MPPLCEELNCLCDVEPLGLPGKESLKVLSHRHRGRADEVCFLGQPKSKPPPTGPGCSSLTVIVRQGLVNEVRRPFKVGAEVELLRIIGLDAQVDDAGILVKVGIGVDVHEGPALGSIQDVGDAQFLQLGDVLSHRPGGEAVAENEEVAPQGKNLSLLAKQGDCTCWLLRLLLPHLMTSPLTPAISSYRQLPQIDLWFQAHAVPSATSG